jgi:hypothetical protein
MSAGLPMALVPCAWPRLPTSDIIFRTGRASCAGLDNDRWVYGSTWPGGPLDATEWIPTGGHEVIHSFGRPIVFGEDFR